MGNWNETLAVDMVFKATAILVVAWMAAVLLRRGSAALRHLIWTAAFAAMLALPLLSVTLPALHVRVSAPLLRPDVVFRTGAAAFAAAPDVPSPFGPSKPPVPQGRDWREWLLRLWAAGTGLSLLQMLVSALAMMRVRRAAKRLSDGDLSGWAQALGIGRHVDLLETRRGSMPMTFGLFRPAVFLPAEAAEWSAERRRVVLLHELAHVQRGDLATHLIARAALSIYWWNPLAWTAWREFLKERERAADDLVLNTGARASDYAGHLLEIARTMQTGHVLGSAALAMARRSQLEGRLVAILDSSANRRAPGGIAAAAATLLAIAVVAPFAALRAQDRTATLPADVDATIRAATAQKNHEMLESAAKAAEVLQKYDLARRLLDSSLDIRAESSGPQSAEYGLGLIKLGDLERSRNNPSEADAFYTKAVSVLGSRPEAAPALIHLGISAWQRAKSPDAALEYFQRAQAADPSHAGPALMWMALIQKEPAEEESLFKQALSMEEPGSAEAALTLELYSSFLNRQKREEEAKTVAEQAAGMRKALGAQAVSVRRGSQVTSFRAGAGVTPPKLLSKVEPAYSEEARLAKYQGTVTVSTDIGTDGTAQGLRVVRGLGLGLDEQALKAIGQWKFQPGVKDGQPVAVQATIEVNFRLL
jgi:TonB family protein